MAGQDRKSIGEWIRELLAELDRLVFPQPKPAPVPVPVRVRQDQRR